MKAPSASEIKRPKTVWPSDELYHIWAHQKAPRGRASGQRVYFEGTIIFSYGNHFPMAKLLIDPKSGEPAGVLLTTRRYSSTTSHHQSNVSAAVRHLKRFYVTDVLGTRTEILADYRRRIAAMVKTTQQATRNKHVPLSVLDALMANGNAYAEFCGLKTRFKFPADFDEKAERAAAKTQEGAAEALRKAREERQRAARERALKEQREKYQKEMAEYGPKLEAWLAGGGEAFPRKPHDPDSYHYVQEKVRLRVRGSLIQTSMGVVFRVASATPLLALCRAHGSGKRDFPDLAVDGYRGVRIDFDAKTVSVGCHTVDFDEAERIAKQLGI